ncbi:hypothetical protein N599_03105 [Saccharopolyspora erythraea D]|nr:hypothetical protein N599_03105 [Saccharopolyspora erythraea D]
MSAGNSGVTPANGTLAVRGPADSPIAAGDRLVAAAVRGLIDTSRSGGPPG